MQKKTLEVLFELQPQRKPSFMNYIMSHKSVIVFLIFIYFSFEYNYLAGCVVFILYLWWDLTRTTLTYGMKLTDRKNLKNNLNNVSKRFYTGSDDMNLRKILADKILVIEKKDTK